MCVVMMFRVNIRVLEEVRGNCKTTVRLLPPRQLATAGIVV